MVFLFVQLEVLWLPNVSGPGKTLNLAMGLCTLEPKRWMLIRKIVVAKCIDLDPLCRLLNGH